MLLLASQAAKVKSVKTAKCGENQRSGRTPQDVEAAEALGQTSEAPAGAFVLNEMELASRCWRYSFILSEHLLQFNPTHIRNTFGKRGDNQSVSVEVTNKNGRLAGSRPWPHKAQR